ncbi:hypothetical protein Nepgr_002772 [Nepenthes gracilis]|uniref:Uncharacterized protein n=1 Tax=Nepenthes gracilis TaxID=150966 RepID=A0AAD3RYF9_NEPGR|nr:hypothetical protein Nepgr_002772 [Nepenthes gracilis]
MEYLCCWKIMGFLVSFLRGVKKVCSECFKLAREEGFKDSAPVKMLNESVEKQGSRERQEGVDWEDVFALLDERETIAEHRAEVKKLAEKVMEIMDENLGYQKITSRPPSTAEYQTKTPPHSSAPRSATTRCAPTQRNRCQHR